MAAMMFNIRHSLALSVTYSFYVNMSRFVLFYKINKAKKIRFHWTHSFPVDLGNN